MHGFRFVAVSTPFSQKCFRCPPLTRSTETQRTPRDHLGAHVERESLRQCMDLCFFEVRGVPKTLFGSVPVSQNDLKEKIFAFWERKGGREAPSLSTSFFCLFLLCLSLPSWLSPLCLFAITVDIHLHHPPFPSLFFRQGCTDLFVGTLEASQSACFCLILKDLRLYTFAFFSSSFFFIDDFIKCISFGKKWFRWEKKKGKKMVPPPFCIPVFWEKKKEK
mmetsp:Transcript_21051/g.54473  ORF Transcript_21051/g.54473 Transcript_21051/m.54473 type:complete len:220 (+) Transcript_21051:4431-5090(+)